MGAVDFVICCHYGASLTVLKCDLERGQIDLSQGSFSDDGIESHALVFQNASDTQQSHCLVDLDRNDQRKLQRNVDLSNTTRSHALRAVL